MVTKSSDFFYDDANEQQVSQDTVLLCIDCGKLIQGEKARNNAFVKIGKLPSCTTCGGNMIATTIEKIQEAIDRKD